MKIDLIQQPTVHGAPLPDPFAEVDIAFCPLPGETMQHHTGVYQIVARAIRICDDDSVEYGLLVNRIGMSPDAKPRKPKLLLQA